MYFHHWLHFTNISCHDEFEYHLNLNEIKQRTKTSHNDSSYHTSSSSYTIQGTIQSLHHMMRWVVSVCMCMSSVRPIPNGIQNKKKIIIRKQPKYYKRPSNAPSMISTAILVTHTQNQIPRNMTKNVPQIEFSRKPRTIIFIIIIFISLFCSFFFLFFTFFLLFLIFFCCYCCFSVKRNWSICYMYELVHNVMRSNETSRIVKMAYSMNY